MQAPRRQGQIEEPSAEFADCRHNWPQPGNNRTNLESRKTPHEIQIIEEWTGECKSDAFYKVSAQLRSYRQFTNRIYTFVLAQLLPFL